MKVQPGTKKKCAFCKIVVRRGSMFVICERDPKHKQRQG